MKERKRLSVEDIEDLIRRLRAVDCAGDGQTVSKLITKLAKHGVLVEACKGGFKWRRTAKP